MKVRSWMSFPKKRVTIVIHKVNGFLGGEGEDNGDYIEVHEVEADREDIERWALEEALRRDAGRGLPVQVWSIE